MDKLVFDLEKTYLAMIMNSVGSETWNSCYCRDSEGRLVDICQGGKFSCAMFVSHILFCARLISSPHATVDSLEADMRARNSGWREWIPSDEDSLLFDTPWGSVVIWEPWPASDGKKHRHAGFCYGGHFCVSTSPFPGQRRVIMHDLLWRFSSLEGRKVEKIYIHSLLDHK
jgi:hypothetical protein